VYVNLKCAGILWKGRGRGFSVSFDASVMECLFGGSRSVESVSVRGTNGWISWGPSAHVFSELSLEAIEETTSEGSS